MRVVTRNPEATRSFAARLARRLSGGEVLCLFGPLGAGKTTFIQGLARALGCRVAATSPSFMLVREYRTRRRAPATLYHMDFYRLGSGELPNLGLEDYLSDPAGACAIEWAECALPSLPADRLELRFAYAAGGRRRTIAVKALGPCSSRLMLRALTPSA